MANALQGVTINGVTYKFDYNYLENTPTTEDINDIIEVALSNGGYITETDLSNYVTTNDLAAALSNSGYINLNAETMREGLRNVMYNSPSFNYSTDINNELYLLAVEGSGIAGVIKIPISAISISNNTN